eukprot:6711027-Prymnesium_polylepis.1
MGLLRSTHSRPTPFWWPFWGDAAPSGGPFGGDAKGLPFGVGPMGVGYMCAHHFDGAGLLDTLRNLLGGRGPRTFYVPFAGAASP